MERSPKQVLISAGLAMTSTALKATFDMPFVCQRIKQVGMLLVGNSSHATAGVIYVTWAVKAGVTTYQDYSTTQNIAILKKTASVAQQGVFVFSRPGINPATGAVYVGWREAGDAHAMPGHRVEVDLAGPEYRAVVCGRRAV